MNDLLLHRARLYDTARNRADHFRNRGNRFYLIATNPRQNDFQRCENHRVAMINYQEAANWRRKMLAICTGKYDSEICHG